MRLVTSAPVAGFLLIGLYILLAVGAASLASLPPGNLTVFWLPAGIGVALVARLGPRLGVPAVFAASLVANFLSMNPGNALAAARNTSAPKLMSTTCPGARFDASTHRRSSGMASTPHFTSMKTAPSGGTVCSASERSGIHSPQY